MTEVTQDDLESVEAENDTKRAVLAALKAHEAALLIGNVFDDHREALLDEGRLLDAQIENQLEVLAGHAGLPSTDLNNAKAQMLAAVQKQVEDAAAASSKASADAKEAVDTEADARAAQEAENAAGSSVSEDSLETLLAVGTRPAPAVAEPQVPAEVAVPVPASTDRTLEGPPGGLGQARTPNPPLPDPVVLGQADNSAKDGE